MLGQSLSPYHPHTTAVIVRGHQSNRFPSVLLDARAERLGFLPGGANVPRRFAEIHLRGQIRPIGLFEVGARNGRDLFSPIGFLGNAERDSLRRTALQHRHGCGDSGLLTRH